MPKAKGGTSKAPERKLRSSGLYSMEWRRVILDEGHTVRNPVRIQMGISIPLKLIVDDAIAQTHPSLMRSSKFETLPTGLRKR